MARMTSALQKLRQLTPAERRLLCRAAARLALFRTALWLVPFRRVQRWAEGSPASHRAPCFAASRIAWAVTVASRLIPSATCLTQALAAQSLLAEEGYASTIHLGVARGERGEFLAHAWVEHEGQVLVGAGTPDAYQSILAIAADSE